MSIQTVQISLIGFMGAGKTSVGSVLAGKTGRQFTDTDEEITAGAGISINEIFARYGEPYFRDLETEQLKKLRKETEPLVISAGGGLPLREENRKLLRQMGPVVFLEASEEELCRRLREAAAVPCCRADPWKKGSARLWNSGRKNMKMQRPCGFARMACP